MNWLDILLALILAVSTIAGLAKGFARSLIGLAAAVVGFLCALGFYGMAGGFLRTFIGSRHLANFIGFLLIFIGIAVLGALVAALMARLLKWAKLSWLDRLLGGGFGLLRGILVAAGLAVAVMAFSQAPLPRSVADSKLAPYIVGAADVIVKAAPFEVKEGFRRSYEQAKKLWAEAMKKRVRELPAEPL